MRTHEKLELKQAYQQMQKHATQDIIRCPRGREEIKRRAGQFFQYMFTQ